MKLPIIYIKDRFVLQEKQHKSNSMLLQEGISLKDDSNNEKTSYMFSENVFIDDNQYFKDDRCVVCDFIDVLQRAFYLYNQQVTIQDNLMVSQFDVEISDLKSINCKQNIVFRQNWCDSNNLYNSNLIQYYVNADILVNNVIYNTFNICRYKFDTMDDFSFFVNDKIQLFEQNNKIDKSFNVHLSNGKNEERYIQEINKQQEDIDQSFSQKLEVNNKQYSVISNKDGLIVNNKIHLSSGNHRLKIKKLNTTKVCFFNISVLSPYRRQLNKVYMLEKRDLNNAKFYSDYEVQQKQVEISNNQIIIC